MSLCKALWKISEFCSSTDAFALPLGCYCMFLDAVCNTACSIYYSFPCIGYVHLFFVQVKESISVMSVILLLVSVATLMFVLSYYVDSICMQR
jgi:hypothetical protein